MNRYVLVAAAVAIAAIGAALAFALYDGSTEATSAGLVPSVAEPTTNGSTEAAPTPTGAATTTEATAAARSRPELEDGRHFGYMKSVDLTSSPATLRFDLAYLLTGDEANEEAARRGYPNPVDDDYFIVNDNPKLRTLVLADDVELRLLDWKHCCDTFFAGNLARFAASFERKRYPAGNYKGNFSAYELTVRDGVVVAADEHFFP